jgi:hypothetical protein
VILNDEAARDPWRSKLVPRAHPSLGEEGGGCTSVDGLEERSYRLGREFLQHGPVNEEGMKLGFGAEPSLGRARMTNHLVADCGDVVVKHRIHALGVHEL